MTVKLLISAVITVISMTTENMPTNQCHVATGITHIHGSIDGVDITNSAGHPGKHMCVAFGVLFEIAFNMFVDVLWMLICVQSLAH